MTYRSTLLSIFVLALSLGSLLYSEPLPPTLVSISTVNSGGTPQVVFTFDRDIRAYSASTINGQTNANGVQSQLPAKPATFSVDTPKSIAYQLDYSKLTGSDSLVLYVTLADATTTLPPTTGFVLDLSFLKVASNYQTQLATLQQTTAALQSQLKQAQSDNANLVAKQSPQSLNYLGPELVGDTSAVLHFQTDRYGAIQVQTAETGKVITDVGTDHHVTLSGLFPNTTYHLTAAAIDLAGNQVATATQQIAISTSQTVPFTPIFKVPAPTSTSQFVLSVDLDPANVLPATFKAYVAAQYCQVIDAASGTCGPPVPIGDGTLNQYGVPQGTPYTKSHDFPVTGLSANTTYRVSLTAYDQYGHKFTSPNQALATTTSPIPSLDFAGPVQMTMDTTSGLTIAWKSNRSIKSASMSIGFTDNSTLVVSQTMSGKDSTDVSVNTNLDGLIAVLQATQSKKQVPIITLTMSDGENNVKSQALAVSFVVSGPSKSSNSAVKNATNNVVTAAAQSNKKINWSDVINTGLGILVKVL